MARRSGLLVTVVVFVVVFFSVSWLFSSHPVTPEQMERYRSNLPQNPLRKAATKQTEQPAEAKAPAGKFKVEVEGIAQSLMDANQKPDNATLKAELGRATWRFLHTMASRLPEKPTKNDRKSFDTFIRLFGHLYPCADCARHFRSLLDKYPPQTSSRNAAAGWLCFMHNKVNERLEKPDFDCNNIGDFYDCGCEDEEGRGEHELESLKKIHKVFREEEEEDSKEDDLFF